MVRSFQTLRLEQPVARRTFSVSVTFYFPKPGLFQMPGLPPGGLNHNRKQGAGCPTQQTCLLQISRRCQGAWSLPGAEAFTSTSGLSGRSGKSSNYVRGSFKSEAASITGQRPLGGAGMGTTGLGFWVGTEAQGGDRADPGAPCVLGSRVLGKL